MSLLKKISFILLLLLSMASCVGGGNGLKTTLSADAKPALRLIEGVEISSSRIQRGEGVRIKAIMADSTSFDSVVMYIDGKRIGCVTEYAFESNEQTTAGAHRYRFEAFASADHQARSGSFTVLASKAPKEYGYKVVKSYPHNESSYTQGLLFDRGVLYEGTGIYGESKLLQVDLQSGKSLRSTSLDSRYFGEGIALLGDKIYQLTWNEGKAFVYDVDDFSKVGSFDYKGEGWGITTDGELLYKSDGSHRIEVINPTDFSRIRTIEVFTDKSQVRQLNELEWVDGRIWANVYMSDTIVIIDPQSGFVEGIIDLSGILAEKDRTSQTDVLNGIAYDKQRKRLFVTGKYWKKLFEIKIDAK